MDIYAEPHQRFSGFDTSAVLVQHLWSLTLTRLKTGSSERKVGQFFTSFIFVIALLIVAFASCHVVRVRYWMGIIPRFSRSSVLKCVISRRDLQNSFHNDHDSHQLCGSITTGCGDQFCDIVGSGHRENLVPNGPGR